MLAVACHFLRFYIDTCLTRLINIIYRLADNISFRSHSFHTRNLELLLLLRLHESKLHPTFRCHLKAHYYQLAYSSPLTIPSAPESTVILIRL